MQSSMSQRFGHGTSSLLKHAGKPLTGSSLAIRPLFDLITLHQGLNLPAEELFAMCPELDPKHEDTNEANIKTIGSGVVELSIRFSKATIRRNKNSARKCSSQGGRSVILDRIYCVV